MACWSSNGVPAWPVGRLIHPRNEFVIFTQTCHSSSQPSSGNCISVVPEHASEPTLSFHKTFQHITTEAVLGCWVTTGAVLHSNRFRRCLRFSRTGCFGRGCDKLTPHTLHQGAVHLLIVPGSVHLLLAFSKASMPQCGQTLLRIYFNGVPTKKPYSSESRLT